MKVGQVTKHEKGNTATSRIFDNDVMAILQICGESGAMRKPDSECVVCKNLFFFIIGFYLTKNENRTKKSLTQLSYYCFE